MLCDDDAGFSEPQRTIVLQLPHFKQVRCRLSSAYPASLFLNEKVQVEVMYRE